MKISNDIKKFAVKSIVFIVIFAVVDIAFGFVADKLYFTQNRKLTYVIEQSDEDVIIFGASRAVGHYNVAIIADSLSMAVYNAGLGGQNIYVQYAMLKSLLERYTPKVVIFDTFDIDIYKTPPTWDRDKLTLFYPYYNRDTAVREIVDLRSQYDNIKMLSNFVRMNSQPASIAILPLFYGNSEVVCRNGGYVVINENNCYNGSYEKVGDEFGSEIDALKLKYIRKFVELCRENSVECIFVSSPIYGDISSSSIVDDMERLTSELEVEYWNYFNDGEFADAALFKDVKHLNSKGADRYSAKIASRLKQEFR
ncbi:Esterase, SGNH hydrolase-type domain [Mucinivorans hirudinis]|uniref:Esterase, SGNH hydrolase-type domain n=1 Tax=Mucinivorans hirudinis TaxID=1433126 RepID=A0A060R6Z2_9BACT|nr:Esterase, SGNH hydrolase-type domain [Mucinivorans hirudinis]